MTVNLKLIPKVPRYQTHRVLLAHCKGISPETLREVPKHWDIDLSGKGLHPGAGAMLSFIKNRPLLTLHPEVVSDDATAVEAIWSVLDVLDNQK